MSDTEDLTTIKKYLLGEITDEEQLREIEESIFLDEKYYEKLLLIEAELADQYAGGELTVGEREKVEKFFLTTPERSRELSFALAVKEFLAGKRGRTDVNDPRNGGGSVSRPEARRNNVRKFPIGKRILSSNTFKIAASVIIVFALGAVVWRIFFYHSDVDRGLIALKEAYKNQRPTEARISVLDYAPPPNQRGGQGQVNSDAERRAGRFLEYAVVDTPSAASYHAFGNYLLAAGHYDEALAQFAKAAELDQNNARLQNDMGVALLEKARAAGGEGTGDEAGKYLVYAGDSLTHFERALEIDRSLLDALFNRALALETLKASEQARESWAKYLEHDSRSEWAEEARRHLDRLNELRQGKTSQNKEQVLNEFLAAYRSGDASRAWQAISRNREVITGKLVSGQLIDAYLDFSINNRGDDARDVLRALEYAGELESKNADDNYTAELARFYKQVTPERLAALSRARELMRQGYKWCQELKFHDAARAFEQARAAFESAGDKLEIYFNEYWLGYSYHQSARSAEASDILHRLIRVCKQKGYKWLLAQALNSSANIQTVLKNYSEGIAETDQSLALSEQIGDTYTVQKNLAQQADKYRKLGNHPQMLKYIGRCLGQSEVSWPGARQMWRNYDSAANAFQALGLYPAALAYGIEAFHLSIEEEDPSTIYVSLTHLGAIYSRLQNHERGIELARQGLAIGQKLSGTREGQKVMAYCLLQLGHLYRQAGELTRAIESYEQAINIYDNLEFRVFSYDAHKGKLLCHIALGDDAASWRELQTALELVEANRKTIREEQNRNDYYDGEQAIYDLAVDFAYTKSGDSQRAFKYSETSHARTLLDLMLRSPRQADDSEGQITIQAVSEPFTLDEIRQRMPERVQILQYAILSDKVIIWLIWKDGFETREKKVNADELNELIRRYLKLISTPPNGSDADSRATAIALYDILLQPVESLLDGKKLLCIVPDKLLNHLPFGALISPTTGKYLIADYPLIYSPSSSVFVSGSEAAYNRVSQSPETLLSVGAPTFDRKTFPRLPSLLPTAAKEARQIKEFYGDGACLIGPAASKESVTRLMKGADIVHFASHYVVDENSPMSSKLLLAKSDGAGEAKGAGGVLTVYDLYRMSLQRTRLVVLAACQTGVERYYKGEGMIGMSRAFIAAGVPTVVVSQWPVDSDATAELMVNFHRQRKQGGFSTAEALQRAQLDMLNRYGQRYQNPYYWAAFVLMGGYGPF
jgi:CHAT domain-containing protein